MLDFAFGPNGYGLTEGMRREQDRITQNRSQFANNMATFLANNPYISPEAAQAFINSAAGTDNTLRGSVPNQLIGELNKENTRKRRIDTFQAFNEFTRLNPGATAAEFQSAMSALGAQGIYGADALKAIQGRSDQYRKDQETARQMKMAQEIGATRNSMMNDVEYQAASLGYDTDKVIKSLKGIYGDNPPVPYETLINPGSMEVMRSKTVRDNLPRAIEILNANPGISLDLLSGAFPALQGSPVLKSIYDAAQTERKKSVQDKFYSNKKQVVDAVAQASVLGLDVQKAYTEAVRGLGISETDIASLDGNAIMAEAQALAKKSKDERATLLEEKRSKASAFVSNAIQAKTANPVEAARWASMSQAQLEQEMRRIVDYDTELTDEEIANLDPGFYTRLVTKVREDLDIQALAAQQQRYDASRGIESAAADAIRKDSTESAKNATSEEALTFLGLKDAASGGGIQAAVRDLATRYDMSGGRAGAAIQIAMELLASDPKAASNLSSALESDVRFKQMFPQIAQIASQQADTIRIRSGSDKPAPEGFTPWVQQETAQIRKENDNYLSTVKSIIDTKASAEDKLNAITNFENRFNNNISEISSAYNERRSSQHIWTKANDRWNDDAFSTVRVELQALQTRVQVEVERAKKQIEREIQTQRDQNMEPGKALSWRDDPNRSGLYNDVSSVFGNIPLRDKMLAIERDIMFASPGESGFVGYFTNSQQDRELAQRMRDISQQIDAKYYIMEHPEVYALIAPDNPNKDVRKFLEIVENRSRK